MQLLGFKDEGQDYGWC